MHKIWPRSNHVHDWQPIRLEKYESPKQVRGEVPVLEAGMVRAWWTRLLQMRYKEGSEVHGRVCSRHVECFQQESRLGDMRSDDLQSQQWHLGRKPMHGCGNDDLSRLLAN